MSLGKRLVRETDCLSVSPTAFPVCTTLRLVVITAAPIFFPRSLFCTELKFSERIEKKGYSVTTNHVAPRNKPWVAVTHFSTKMLLQPVIVLKNSAEVERVLLSPVVQTNPT